MAGSLDRAYCLPLSMLLTLLSLLSCKSILAEQNALTRLGGRFDDDNDRKLILQESLVQQVNTDLRASWKAGFNPRFLNHTVQDVKRLCGSLKAELIELDPLVQKRSYSKDVVLPVNFDAREAWAGCPSLKTILDQGHCGSCWAFGAVEALTDRFCILASENVTLSENDLLACCGFECGYGCEGGYPLRAWQYFRHSGVVTAKCDPYFDQKGCQHPGCDPLLPTPNCTKECVNNQLWGESKHYSVSSYAIAPNVHDIMAEVFTNGPVEVAFSVFEDFAHYKSGVYRHLYGNYLGGHAVKLVGWGTTEDGLDYWIIANSWNRSWGEDGFFKILRGVNECGIEGEAVAGIPFNRYARHSAE
ncbi:hypothetical protein O6H91_06G041300 [Diphasiastrum complanatum]|uniref:Uncharacterized protein n=1 Tax=Diphasiastrum complanatum TaxID=34168 RepID=A0ACC2DD17_DIPCM|nr:hypothetical protein O6H91_06G041300 [Diphasiastrum complanatum]